MGHGEDFCVSIEDTVRNEYKVWDVNIRVEETNFLF